MRAMNRDTIKWFVFHKYIGHDTRDYRLFKKEIENLLSKVYLGDLVSNGNQRNEVKLNKDLP